MAKDNIDTMSLSIREEEEEEHRAYATQLFSSMALPMTMQAAIDLNLLEIIAKAGHGTMLSVLEIASEMPHNNPIIFDTLQRILNFLTSFNVLTVATTSGEARYGLAPVAKYFVKNEEGVSFAPLMTVFHDKVFVESWFKLKNVVVGEAMAFEYKEKETNEFDYQGVDPVFSDAFNQGMMNHTKIMINELLQAYGGFHDDMESITLVDVGGGLGATVNAIVSMYPKIKGINFDLPHVISQAPTYPGVEHVKGNMFETIPKADVIFVKCILIDWSDEDCLKLLKNCYEALPAKGKVIVIDVIAPEIPDNKTNAKSIYSLDMVALSINHGGKARTFKQFQVLATQAGFARIEMCYTTFTNSIIEFNK